VLVDIGLLVEGPLSPLVRGALERAREGALAWLYEGFPQFQWAVTVSYAGGEGDTSVPSLSTLPVIDLLDRGVRERDDSRRDFVVVLTSAKLASPFGALRFGIISRSLDCAVVSLGHLDPGPEKSLDERMATISSRIRALLLRILALFSGLTASEPEGSPLASLRTARDLDIKGSFTADQKLLLRKEISRVADARLEETPARKSTRLSFFVRSAWINRYDIALSVLRAQPWLFPMRLGRLTTAALSAIFIFLITAEAWELAASQTVFSTALISVSVILLTTAYVVVQHSLLRNRGQRNTEQRVTSEVSALGIVLIGMMTTYALLFVFIFTVVTFVFDMTLLSRWVQEVTPTFAYGQLLIVSAFVAAIGLSVGALGASLEEVGYFRYVTLVDEAL